MVDGVGTAESAPTSLKCKAGVPRESDGPRSAATLVVAGADLVRGAAVHEVGKLGIGLEKDYVGWVLVRLVVGHAQHEKEGAVDSEREALARQTGVLDRAALDAAIGKGILCGGWCSKAKDAITSDC